MAIVYRFIVYRFSSIRYFLLTYVHRLVEPEMAADLVEFSSYSEWFFIYLVSIFKTKYTRQ